MPKRILKGVVVSDKADKTITVSVERRFTDPLFKKTVRSSKKYMTLMKAISLKLVTWFKLESANLFPSQKHGK